MKKAVLLIAALVVVSSMVFAAEPVAELKITTFSGSCAVTLGVDLGTGSAAFTNADVDADLVLDLVGAGDKSTTGDNIWGELKIKTDGDPIRIKTEDGVAVTSTSLSGFKVLVDVAKLHIGSMAYIGIKHDGTTIDYVTLPDEGAAVYWVDPAKRYGQIASGFTPVISGVAVPLPPGATTPAAGSTILTDGSAGLGPDAPYGIVAGVSLPNLVNVDVDFRSINQFSSGDVAVGSNQLVDGALMNRYGIRAKIDVTAVPNLTAQAGVGTGVGGDKQFYDIAFGGKVAYKLMLDDKMFVRPTVAANAVYDVAAGGATSAVENGTKDLGFIANAGVLLGWGDRTKLNHYFSPDKDIDPSGYWPGVAAGVQITSKKVLATTLSKDFKVGLNVSAFSGSIVEGLSANAALEIDNILRDSATEGMIMGAVVNAKYDVKMDPMTITPRFGLYFMNMTFPDGTPSIPGLDEFKTDVFVKAGLDIAKIFPNTTLSFDYNSNDFVGGVGNIPSADQTMVTKPLGIFSTTLKIAF